MEGVSAPRGDRSDFRAVELAQRCYHLQREIRQSQQMVSYGAAAPFAIVEQSRGVVAVVGVPQRPD